MRLGFNHREGGEDDGWQRFALVAPWHDYPALGAVSQQRYRPRGDVDAGQAASAGAEGVSIHPGRPHQAQGGLKLGPRGASHTGRSGPPSLRRGRSIITLDPDMQGSRWYKSSDKRHILVWSRGSYEVR